MTNSTILMTRLPRSLASKKPPLPIIPSSSNHPHINTPREPLSGQFDKTTANMGVAFLEHLGGVCFFLCAKCNTFLSNCSNCFDKNFVGRTGRAFLFNKVVNVVPGPAQPRQMITGKFMVSLRLGCRGRSKMADHLFPRNVSDE